MKTCPVCRQQFPTKAALAAHRVTHQQRASARRRRSAPGNGSNTMALKEYWGTVRKDGVTTIDIHPATCKLAKLSALARVYEQYRIVSWTVHFVHSAGSNTSGSYFAGVSAGTHHPTDRKGIASLSPSLCRAVTTDGTLTAPASRVMGQPWLDMADPAPGVIMVSTDAALEAWITYRVLLSGPTSVAQASTVDAIYRTDGTKWMDESGADITEFEVGSEFQAEMELNTMTEAENTTVWARVTAVWRDIRVVHRAYQQAVGMAHFLMSAGTYVLPTLGRPAILHLQQAPFRSDRYRIMLRRSVGFKDPAHAGVRAKRTTAGHDRKSPTRSRPHTPSNDPGAGGSEEELWDDTPT